MHEVVAVSCRRTEEYTVSKAAVIYKVKDIERQKQYQLGDDEELIVTHVPDIQLFDYRITHNDRHPYYPSQLF